MIKKRRAELGMTLEEVGDIVGVSKSTVKKWETGYISNMRRDKIAKLSEALMLDPTDFIDVAGGEVSEREERKIAVISDKNAKLLTFRVDDGAMKPLLLEGDSVLIRRRKNVGDGAVSAVSIDGGKKTVRRVYKTKDKIELTCENPDFPDLCFEGAEAERVKIIGRVIESKRKF